MKCLPFLLLGTLLASCASVPQAPSSNVRASCPSPLAIKGAEREWYSICRDAALVEHKHRKAVQP